MVALHFADEKFMVVSGKATKLYSMKDKKEILKIPSDDVCYSYSCSVLAPTPRPPSLSRLCHVMKEALTFIGAIVIAGPYPADVCV